MSDTEEETFYFGTPLEPYDEDAFPKKRPIALEEQVAKDAQGRRRFHGAFTGGFSAGFFNTVGSVQGWTPSEFKSSRGEKAENKQQKPEDFMDEEDLGEFGIAPQAIRATKDYSTSKKRKKQVFVNGPIPGVPVLETLLQAGNETVGYFLMKNMNRKQKALEQKANQSGPKVYGCAMPKDLPEDDTFNPLQYNLHEIYKQYLSSPKINTFGIGYVGLDKSHLNLFESTKLTLHERNNKKLSISGQAFGVGAFEDEDEDIYVKDNMSRYDFELTAESSSTDQKNKSQKRENLVLDAFISSKKDMLLPKNEFPPPVIPASFTGKHNVKKSRFEPLPEKTETSNRKDMNASIRSKYLGEDHSEKIPTPSNQQHKEVSKQKRDENSSSSVKAERLQEQTQEPSTSSGLIFDRFVSAKQDDDPTNILEEVKRSETTHGTKEMHAAVKLKMFGPLTRTTISWQPCSLLCKRFNVPEPTFDELNSQKNKKRTKNLIFEYQKHVEKDSLTCKPGLSIQSDTTKTETEVMDEEPSKPEDTIIKEETSISHIDSEEVIEEESVEEQEKEIKNESSDKMIDLTDRVDVSKNTDLFKAVFLSSSESESEAEDVDDKEEKERREMLTANVVSEPLVPKIKSTREGILSNIDFSKFNSSIKTNEKSNEQNRDQTDPANIEPVSDSDSSNMYGPKLPASTSNLKPLVIEEVKNNDEWIEKKSLGEKHKKHKKKHKREKDKHKKKHKHKSKR